MTRSMAADRKSDTALPLSVVILTHNEEKNLAECLCSLAGLANDIHVLDSGSTDATVEVAKTYGVAVYSNPFRGFGQQRNWAIDNIPHRHKWILHLDADERMTTELATELHDVLMADRLEAGFFVASKLMLGGHWLRYSSGYPVYQVRVFHRDRLRFEDHGHGQREQTTGTLGYLRSAYLHDAYAKGLDDWFAKHARYARCEATQVRQDRRGVFSVLRQLVSPDPVVRRRALKRITYTLPCRPMLRLIQLLVLNRGLLDGPPGLLYARMMAAYESMLNTYLTRDQSGIDI